MGEITKGTVVRFIKSKGAFDGEETDINGKLEEASVNAKEDETTLSKIFKDENRGNYSQYATCDASKIKKKGGIIRKVPVSGNPNHCQIHGITISEANNLFSNHIDF